MRTRPGSPALRTRTTRPHSRQGLRGGDRAVSIRLEDARIPPPPSGKSARTRVSSRGRHPRQHRPAWCSGREGSPASGEYRRGICRKRPANPPDGKLKGGSIQRAAGCWDGNLVARWREKDSAGWETGRHRETNYAKRGPPLRSTAQRLRISFVCVRRWIGRWCAAASVLSGRQVKPGFDFSLRESKSEGGLALRKNISRGSGSGQRTRPGL